MTTVNFVCNGEPIESAVLDGESLLTVLRERLQLRSANDGCAPQGQCGCCTVLIDGEPRVACVTPITRVAGRTVTTIEGLDPTTRTELADRFCDAGATQCGFCTPGIIMRIAPLYEQARCERVALDRALAAHLCRCTGWQTIVEAVVAERADAPRRDLDAAATRATLETGSPQIVGPDVALGAAGFADDRAPTEALVAVPRPPGSPLASGSSPTDAVEAAGIEFVVASSLVEARVSAGKTQGRRTTLKPRPPFAVPPAPDGGVAWGTHWVEPAYLEPDASWCEPGGTAASPVANGGAFGGKVDGIAARAARELADRYGRAVRVVFSREDVVRLGPKRPPIAGTAVLDGSTVRLDIVAAGPIDIANADRYGLDVDANVEVRPLLGPPVARLRAPWAESAVLIEAALDAASFERAGRLDGLGAAVLLDNCVESPHGAFAGVALDHSGSSVRSVHVRVAAGDPLDDIVLRSYCIGATHMALGWMTSEGITVDPETGEVHDLTIRSFGVVRPKDMPEVVVDIVDDPRPPIPHASDAVFAAVAAACLAGKLVP